MSSGRSVAGRGPGPGARRRGGHRSLPANNIYILEEDEVLARPRTPPTSEYLIEVATGLRDVSKVPNMVVSRIFAK